jgi:hypothetical protein
MVVVTSDHAPQRVLDLATHRLVGRSPAVRHIGHNQNPQAISPVQLARHFDLDVNPLPVQTDLPGPQDLVAHEGIVGKRVVAFRMVGLVQCQLQVDRLIVQHHVRVIGPRELAHADLAHPEIRVDRILDPRALQDGLDVVQVGIVQRPQPRLLQRQDKRMPPSSTGKRFGDDRFRPVAFPKSQLKADLVRRGLVQGNVDADFLGIDIGSEMDGFQCERRPRFQIDRLPDPRGSPVALFALELERVRRVVDAEDQPLRLADPEVFGQIEGKGGVAAPGVRPACVRPARPWYASRRRRPREIPAGRSIPEGPGSIGRTTRYPPVLDAREWRAPGKGNRDLRG